MCRTIGEEKKSNGRRNRNQVSRHALAPLLRVETLLALQLLHASTPVLQEEESHRKKPAILPAVRFEDELYSERCSSRAWPTKMPSQPLCCQVVRLQGASEPALYILSLASACPLQVRPSAKNTLRLAWVKKYSAIGLGLSAGDGHQRTRE